MSTSQTNVFDLASLDAWIYRDDIGTPQGQQALPGDAGTWTVLRTVTDGITGFQAAELINSRTNEIVIAIRGTVPGLLQNDLEDLLLGSASTALSILNPIAEEATAFAEQVARANPGATITLTGHSLGGYAAQVASVDLLAAGLVSPSSLNTVTFNAPGIPASLDAVAALKGYQNAYNFNTQGDAIHLAGGTQLGQSIMVAVGPSPSQKWTGTPCV